MHTSVLNHVLKHSKRSPHKAQLPSYSPRVSKFVTPSKKSDEADFDKKIPSTLRKIAVLRSKRKHTEAKRLRVQLKSQFNIKSIAEQTGDTKIRKETRQKQGWTLSPFIGLRHV